MIYYFLQTSVTCPESYEIYIDGGTHIATLVIRYGLVTLDMFTYGLEMIKEYEDRYKGNLSEEELDDITDKVIRVLDEKYNRTNSVSVYRIETSLDKLLEKIT